MTTTLQVKDKGVHIMVQGGSYLYGKIPEGELKKKLTESATYVKDKGLELAGAAVETGKQTAAYVGKKGYDIGVAAYDKVKDNESVMNIGTSVYNQAKVVTGAVGNYIASKTGSRSGSMNSEVNQEAHSAAVDAPLVANPELTKDVKEPKPEDKKEEEEKKQ